MQTRMVGYVRASRWERGTVDERLAAQRAALEAAARERGFDLVAIEEDRAAGRTLRRPGLQAALERCHAGEADGIAVTRLDRLTRSLDDLGSLLAVAHRRGLRIVADDLDLDTARPDGALVERVLAEASGWGRSALARERVREELAPYRAEPGRRGRPSSTPPEVADRIRRLRADGLTLQAICDQLNEEGVPTPRGGAEWRPTSLRAVLRPPIQKEAHA